MDIQSIPLKKLIFCTLLFLNATFLKAQNTIPKVVSGRIERIENFHSKYITQRNVDIWLPEGYSNSAKYAVLYMHDGQMLYDSSGSWNKQAWDIDDVATELLQTKKVKKFIVVGIWNGGSTRHTDYFPQQPYEQLSQKDKDTVNAQLQRTGRSKKVFIPQSDQYLKFIVHELKPYIDSTYSVYSNRENTFIAGSSMGGLISMYAICEYPTIFGGAACMSTHWPGTFTLQNNPVPDAFISYLNKHLPSPKNHKIYFDCGDQTLDALYPSIQKQVDDIMSKKGYNKHNWLTKYFPGEDHSEKSWKKRLNIPLEFLLGNDESKHHDNF
ncbi:MAG: alpha/beta hydrolase [Bacteroidota bacterium]|nr:alpha/beta hydrolase [Bacteroidota bacterium]